MRDTRSSSRASVACATSARRATRPAHSQTAALVNSTHAALPAIRRPRALSARRLQRGPQVTEV